MILVDTSIWIDHLRRGDRQLVELLDGGRVVMHPFVLGELACGNLQDRGQLLALLHKLPRAVRPNDDEVLFFIEAQELGGRGIGFVDAHLLASALLSEVSLWTRDRRLHKVAADLGLTSQR